MIVSHIVIHVDNNSENIYNLVKYRISQMPSSVVLQFTFFGCATVQAEKSVKAASSRPFFKSGFGSCHQVYVIPEMSDEAFLDLVQICIQPVKIAFFTFFQGI